LSARARVERNLGNLDEAEEHGRSALDLSPDGSAERLAAEEILGRVLLDRGEVDASIETFATALETARNTASGTRAEVIALNHLARSKLFGGRTAEARSLLEEAIALDRKVHGTFHADTAWTIDNLGLVELADQNYPEAENLFRKALQIEADLHGSQHPRSAWSLRNLGNSLLRQDRISEAIVAFEESLGIITRATPGNTSEVRATLMALAQAEALRGDEVKSSLYSSRALSLPLPGLSP
jgi:tetratricopeptide (TPR) repeat protein